MRRKKAFLLGLAIAFSISGLTAAGVAAVSDGPGGADDLIFGGDAEAAAESGRSRTAAATGRSAPARRGTGSPGYRRESRKRVQPPKRKTPWDVLLASKWVCFGKAEFTIELAQMPVVEFKWLGAQLESARLGAELGKLATDDRIEKAAEELSLTPGQVELLEQAVAEKEAAAKDPARAAKAVEVFKERVDVALNDDQRRRWNEKGYEHAFGAGRPVIHFGYSTVVKPAQTLQLTPQSSGTYRLVVQAVSQTLQTANEKK